MHTGMTISNLEDAASKAVQPYIEVVQPVELHPEVFGCYKTTYKEPMTNMSFSLSFELNDRIKRTSQECGLSLAEFCRRAAEAYLDALRADTLL